MFATEKQKEKYVINGNKFISSHKQTIIKQARRECEIEDLGNRKYKILKVYKYPMPKNFDKMNSGLHQYLTPLILMNLISAKIYEVENISFTCMKWYKMIEMINDNYINIKKNMDYVGRSISVSKNALTDYFNTTDETLIYYFKKSLEYLKDANIFNFQEINWVCVKEIENKDIDSNNKKINFKITHVHRRATHEEMEFVRNCDQEACSFVGIKNDDNSEKFYGKDSQKYLAKYKELLLGKNIAFCYKAFEIYSTDKDIERCYKLLEEFNIKDKTSLILSLNEIFKKNIVLNVEKRIDNNHKKYRFSSKRDRKEFLEDYKRITMLTIGPLSDEKNRLKDIPKQLNIIDEMLINDLIDDTVSVEYDGAKIKLGVEKQI